MATAAPAALLTRREKFDVKRHSTWCVESGPSKVASACRVTPIY